MSCCGGTLCWRQQSRLTGSLEGLAASCGMPDGRAQMGSGNRLRRQDTAARGLGRRDGCQDTAAASRLELGLLTDENRGLHRDRWWQPW
jgi:hypothetical protein